MRPRKWRSWIGVQAIGALVGLILISALLPDESLTSLAPLGSALGANLGALLWVGACTFAREGATKSQGQGLSVESLKQIGFLTTILAVASAQWVDSQFSFLQATTQPLWWIIVGLLVKTTLSSSTKHASLRREEEAWLAATASAGFFLLHSLGTVVQSEIVTQRTGSSGLALTALGATLLAGVVGSNTVNAAATNRRQGSKPRLNKVLLVGGTWVFFFLLKGAFRALAGNILDEALVHPGTSTTGQLRTAGLFLSLSGIVAVIAAVVGFAIHDGRPTLKPVSALILGSALLIGSIGYAQQFTGASLHHLGNTLYGSRQASLLPAADAAFQAAASMTPTNSRLRLHWTYLLMTRAAAHNGSDDSTIDRIADQVEIAFSWEPFAINSREWADFIRDYAVLQGSRQQD